MKKKDKLLVATTEEGTNIILDASVSKEEIANWRAAEELVIKHEQRKGWKAAKVSNCGYDIISTKGKRERHIEVKSKAGIGKKFAWLELTDNETRQFRNDPNYYVYLIEGECQNLTAVVKIVELSKAQLETMAREKIIVRFTKLSGLARTTITR